VALVTAAFAAGDVAHHLVGSGVLVPRSPGAAVTALTFVSQKWPRSSCADEVVVRASLGRHGDDGVLELDDDTLAKVALEELAAILGVVATPLEVLVQRWPASFPQYLTGHLARVARIEELTAALPGLELAGASYRGIGIPACVEDGRRAAARLTAALPAG
jgi:oxygen-dependent protoporphyrinogen oxidase